MPHGASSSELWLLRTYFGEGDDTTWASLIDTARSARSSVSGAALVVSSDLTQCQQRIRRVVGRLATRAEANDGLYVALADKQTFMRHDRLLLTMDCSAAPLNAERIPTTRMSPAMAFRLGIDERSPGTGLPIQPVHLTPPKTIPALPDSERTNTDSDASVRDAIRASLNWRRQMTRDGSFG
ncbi:hypothetical protein ASG84_19335 [Rhodococcus sp. Leaf278]|uniref:DUF6924 domain-containing protein n=1 Tax=Rhodococcus sp. Leaf278 TaxID=1736319 RepID=UPI00070FB4F4|nr:hypothetical protein [Rhodococcus sp. Leaf278]KQU56774.1 hypothetical protein ASG84_19335 [Rhodococcus sp. Leaf278]